MEYQMLIVFGLVGWCPTPRPKPKPEPIPLDLFAGFVGGIAGAYLVHWAMGFDGPLSSVDFLTLAVGAFVLGRVFRQVALWIFPTPE